MFADQDGAEPSTNSVAALNLVRLADVFDKSEYRDRARKIFAGFSQRLAKHAFILPKMITAYQRWTRPPTQARLPTSSLFGNVIMCDRLGGDRRIARRGRRAEFAQGC